MPKTTPRRHRGVVATGGTLLISGLAFSATLAAQQLAPLPARLAEALHGQDATTRAPHVQAAARPSGGKAPGSIAPSPEGAPGNILFSANFNDCSRDPPVPAPPAPPHPSPLGFTVHNVDNRTPATNVNYVDKAWIVREDFQTDATDCVMFSTSWYSPFGAADDWAAFPTATAGKITPTAATQLRWNAKAYDPNYRDGYQVRYSTTGTAVADFLANPALYTNPAEEAAWNARTLNLSALAGTPIHLAFRNNSNDKFLLVIDDIVVENIAQFDPALPGVENTAPSAGYGVVPAWLGMAYDLSADVLNSGSQTLTGVTVAADLLVDGAPVDSVTSAPLASLAPAASATVPVTSGLLDQLGRWTVEATVDAVEGDELADNSSIEAYLVHVSSDEISRAVPDAAQNGTLGIGAGNGGELGNDFVIDVAAKLVSIRYTLENPDGLPDNPDPAPDGDGIGDLNGVTMQATLRAWNTVTDEPGVLLQTVDFVVPADAPLGPTTLEFPLPAGTVLPPGRYLVAAVEPTSPPQTLQLHNVGERFTPGTSWVDWPTNTAPSWSNVEDFGANFAHPFRISAVLVPTVAEPVAADDAFTLDEDDSVTGDVSTNDSLSDDGGNVWTLVTGPANGLLTFNPDGSFTYAPAADFNGSDSFTYSLCDVDADCSEADVALTVTAVNDVPVAVDDVFSVDEDATLSDTVAGNDTLSGDGGNTWELVADAEHGTLVLQADGSFDYTPDADFNGTDSFTYAMCDGEDDCSSATASITVDPVNDVPVAADDSFTVAVTDVLTGSVAGNDTASPDGVNVWSVTVQPASGTLTMSPDGDFSFTPAAVGSVSFEYSVGDDGGAGDCATATATIDVTAVEPELPEIFADSFESN